MSEEATLFEKISFWGLLKRHTAEIPIIQRDYAQGRTLQKSVRNRFLNSLHGAIEKKPIELDFIYGNLHGDSFQPLDGQQRLTTLFLLHWYAARQSELEPDAYQATLAKFSYETRSSSKAFCHGLVLEDFDVDFKSSTISGSIKDCPWYFATWQHDPTVDGMLRMLDAIHVKFKGVENLWQRLTQSENCPITFYFTTLERCGLSDDLYIKMNARGKPLTAFENFKALLEQHITESKWDSGRTFEESFSTKVDTVWTDAFWSLVKKSDDGERHIDAPMLNFFNQVAVCSIASGELPATSKEQRVRELLVDGQPLEVSHIDQAGYEDLYASAEVVRQKELVQSSVKLSLFRLAESLNDLLMEVVQATDQIYQKRVLLQAQLRFFAHGGKPDEKYLEWMRVARNIVQQATIDSPESFIGAIRLINELSCGSQDIYAYLLREKVESSFGRSQVLEEIRKAKIIATHPEQKALLHELEDLPFCRGRIAFALYCVNEDESTINLDFKELAKVCAVIKRDLSTGITTELRRALFTIGDGRFYNYWTTSYLHAVGAPKRCAIENDEEFRKYAYNLGFRDYLKRLIVQLTTAQSVVELLRDYKPTHETPNWILRLIKEDFLMDASMLGYFAVREDDSVCYLVPRSKVAVSEKGVRQLVEVR